MPIGPSGAPVERRRRDLSPTLRRFRDEASRAVGRSIYSPSGVPIEMACAAEFARALSLEQLAEVWQELLRAKTQGAVRASPRAAAEAAEISPDALGSARFKLALKAGSRVREVLAGHMWAAARRAHPGLDPQLLDRALAAPACLPVEIACAATLLPHVPKASWGTVCREYADALLADAQA